MNKDKLFIYNVINKKYQNNIIPNIPKLLVTYLLKNPNKIELYLRKEITIDNLLNNIKYDKKTNILEKISKFVEEDSWKLTSTN